MPLQQGGSRETISANIAELIRSGRDPKQAAAIAYASARKAKDAAPAAGVMFTSPNSSVLLMKRNGHGDFSGHWAFPGGHAEGDESPMRTAGREAAEETGFSADPARLRHLGSTAGMPTEFHTFGYPAPAEFQAAVTDEHSEAGWFPLDKLPQPLHPGVEKTLSERLGVGKDMSPEDWAALRQGLGKWLSEEEQEAAHAQDEKLAFDRGSVRAFDKNGHLIVSRTPVTKAAINEYYGREIPDAEALGLDPARRYRLLRDPEEIKKAAKTWNSKPLLISHQPVKAEEHPRELVVGSLGSEAEYEHPYLYNSIAVWDKDAIDAIESGRQREISSAYHYRADMTPGTWEGQAYDGVMRDLHGNHAALVKDGRAGADVVVQDEQPLHPWDFGAFGMSQPAFAFDAFEEGRHKRDRSGMFSHMAEHHADKAGEQDDLRDRVANSEQHKAHHGAAAAAHAKAHHHFRTAARLEHQASSGETDKKVSAATKEEADKHHQQARGAARAAMLHETAASHRQQAHHHERMAKSAGGEHKAQHEEVAKRFHKAADKYGEAGKFHETHGSNYEMLSGAHAAGAKAHKEERDRLPASAHSEDHIKRSAQAEYEARGQHRQGAKMRDPDTSTYAAAGHLQSMHEADAEMVGDHHKKPAQDSSMSKYDFSRFAMDAKFEESKHPRANNGQFGAGAGKSHAEHAAHHRKQTDTHLDKALALRKEGKPEAASTHSFAARQHEEARAQHHNIAGYSDESRAPGRKEAHEASRKARESSYEASRQEDNAKLKAEREAAEKMVPHAESMAKHHRALAKMHDADVAKHEKAGNMTAAEENSKKSTAHGGAAAAFEGAIEHHKAGRHDMATRALATGMERHEQLKK